MLEVFFLFANNVYKHARVMFLMIALSWGRQEPDVFNEWMKFGSILLQICVSSFSLKSWCSESLNVVSCNHFCHYRTISSVIWMLFGVNEAWCFRKECESATTWQISFSDEPAPQRQPIGLSVCRTLPERSRRDWWWHRVYKHWLSLRKMLERVMTAFEKRITYIKVHDTWRYMIVKIL